MAGAAALLLVGSCLPLRAAPHTRTMTPDDVESYRTLTPEADYTRREVFIPMRDGVKLYTLILMKKGTRDAPILLTRTPYGADTAASYGVSQRLSQTLAPWNAAFVDDGYIRVFQDVRGRHRSQGVFVANRPPRGPLNATGVDESTDAYDTIAWLTRHLEQSNGRVAMIGGSYDGWLTLMATIHPNPALKAVVAVNPMVDLWRGDDWYHYGAFRQVTLVAIPIIMAGRSGGGALASGREDAYSLFLSAGSAGDFVRRYLLGQFPYVRKLMEHPAYDAWWRDQALERLLAQQPLEVPTLLVGGQWDEQDIYGATAVYRALEPRDRDHDKVFLALGPWRHMGALEATGGHLGALRFRCQTAREFRRDELKPFLDEHLKPGTAAVAIPSFRAYATGGGRWDAMGGLPKAKATRLYLRGGFALAPAPPTARGPRSDAYVSDPSKPVPSAPRPFRFIRSWETSLVADQRFASDRTDVLTYETPPLRSTVHIIGWPEVELYAATTGTDSDWVVKLIDVYPEQYGKDPDLAGYQLGISMDIFRGRYLHGFDRPQALTPGKIEEYRFSLPMADHVFRKGHRIMVQIQSSWFPIYDRNPQTFVPNIFHARPADYRKAAQRVFRDAKHPSAIVLPVVPG